MKLRHLLTFAVALATSSFGKTIPNHAIANLVLGQEDFVTGTAGNPVSSFTMNAPRSIAIDPVTRKVFVSDNGNHRVLRFPSVSSLSNGAGAEAVFGQVNFSSTTTAATATGMFSPQTLFLDRKGRLWVADYSNNRVLMFEAAVYRSSSPSADRVFGQPDFTTVTSGTSSTKMDNPWGVFVDSDDRLWVSETGNDRVLRFDSITTKASGAAADGVLGQPDFNTSGGGSGASKFVNSEGISVSSSGTLFVADPGGDRVLRFDNAATLANGAAASAVFGQLDFATTGPGTTASKFDFSSGAFITPEDTLWVTDSSNHRLLRFENASSKPSGAAADGVVGQSDFTTATAATTNRGLDRPFVQAYVDPWGNLWTGSLNNHRVLRFPPDVTKPAITVNKPPKKTSKKRVKITGTASDQFGISKVQYKVNNGGVKTANGKNNWSFKAKLKKGKKNKIKIWAVDSVGNKSKTKTVKVRRTKN